MNVHSMCLNTKADAARAPKEFMRRSLLSARKQMPDIAEPQQPQDEQPEQYAEARIEHAAANAARDIGDEAAYRGKQLMLKASHRIKQSRQSHGGTEQNRSSFYSAESNAARQGREYVRRNAQISRFTAQSTPQNVKQSAEPAKAAKGTVKTIRRGVKTAQHTVKTAERTVKSTQQAAKAAQRTAQATAKAAQTAGRTAQLAAKAAATTATAAAKAVAAIIKAIISAAKELVAAIAAGG